MDRYFIFRSLMDMMADFSNITNAELKDYSGNTVITGEADGKTVVLTFEVREEKKDA